MRRAALLLCSAALGAVPPALSELLTDLHHGDPFRRGEAATALGQLGEPAVPALAALLRNGPVEARRGAAIALARMGVAGRPALPELIQALTHRDHGLRQAAAHAIGGLGTLAEAALRELTACLHDPDDSVREAATLALSRVDPLGRARPRTLEAQAALVERLVPTLMAELHVPGVAVTLIHDRAVIWTRGFGVRSAATREPVSADTVFEAASMSKPILAMLAMGLVDQGRLDLDCPLEVYGTDLQVPIQPARGLITARMALSHTSGYPNWRPGGEEEQGPLPLRFHPGTRFHYSGEGIFHLQRQLERLVGQPLEAWASAALFMPLGLRRTAFRWTPELGRHQASGHGDDGAVRPASRYHHANAAYTLYTTATEYGRLLVELLQATEGRSRHLSQGAALELLRPQVKVDAREPIERPGRARGQEVYWGLGWSLNTTAQGPIAHHSGANQTGFRCFSQISPGRGTGLVIFTNGTRGSDLWTRVVAALGDL